MHVFIFVCIVLLYMCNELHQVVVILAAVVVLAFAEVAVTGLVTIVKIVVLI